MYKDNDQEEETETEPHPEIPPRRTSNPTTQIRELEKAGDSAALLNLLKAENNSIVVRRAAAKALANVARPENALVLAQFFTDESDRAIRLNLIRALGKLGDDATLPLLLNALKDRETLVRLEAAHALSRFNSSAGFEALLVALQQRNEANDREIRQFAAEALGQLGDRRAVAPLCEALKDEAELVRATAAKALGQLGDRSALPTLRRARHTTPHLRGVNCAECEAIDEAIRGMKEKE